MRPLGSKPWGGQEQWEKEGTWQRSLSPHSPGWETLLAGSPEWGHLKGPHCSSPPHVSRGKGVSDEANDTTFQGMD